MEQQQINAQPLNFVWTANSSRKPSNRKDEETAWNPIAEIKFTVEIVGTSITLTKISGEVDVMKPLMQGSKSDHINIPNAVVYELDGFFAGAEFTLKNANTLGELIVLGSGVPVIRVFQGPLNTV